MSRKPKRSWPSPDYRVLVGPAVAVAGAVFAGMPSEGRGLAITGSSLVVAGLLLWASNGFGWLERRMFLEGWIEELGGNLPRSLGYRLSGQDATYAWFACVSGVVMASAVLGAAAFGIVASGTAAATWLYARRRVRTRRVLIAWSGGKAPLVAALSRAIEALPRYSETLSWDTSQEAYDLVLVVPAGERDVVGDVRRRLAASGIATVEPAMPEWEQW